jgi:hypothetical protein
MAGKKTGKRKKTGKAGRTGKFVKPVFCDMGCEHADWPRDEALDGSGSCRTFQAIHCNKLNRVVHKNGPCQA